MHVQMKPIILAKPCNNAVVPFRGKSSPAGQEQVKFEKFHAHVYFNNQSQGKAQQLRDSLERNFPQAQVGGLINRPVGPHPEPMFAMNFKEGIFSPLTQFLMEKRNGLSVLIHPETNDELRDHTERPLWMGEQKKLRLSALG